MENSNILTSYLNPKKYTALSKYKETHYLIRIDSDFLDEGQFSFSENVTKIKKEGPPIAEDFGGGFRPIRIQHPLVVTRNGDEINYYFRRNRNGITTYVSLEHALLPQTNESHFLPYNNLTFLPITLQHLHYYHLEQQRVYSVENTLPEIEIFGHKTLDYNPKDLGGLTDGEYELDYKNASGYTNTVSDQIFGMLEQGSNANLRRKVNFSLYIQAGKVYWYPRIEILQGKII